MFFSRPSPNARVDDWKQQLTEMRAAKDDAFRFDPGSPIPLYERDAFAGLSYYPPDERFRVVVPLVEERPVRLDIERSAGDVVPYIRRGHLPFKVPMGQGKLALYESNGHAFVPFRDATSGRETYGAGRYLDPLQQDDGRYVLDFNQAYYPFCAYNEAYSCPFPPPENWLTFAIPAGERNASAV